MTIVIMKLQQTAWIFSVLIGFPIVTSLSLASEKPTIEPQESSRAHVHSKGTTTANSASHKARSILPRIFEVIGQASNRKKPDQIVNSKMPIGDALSLSLKENSIVRVKLDEGRTLTAYGPAEFSIPLIGWETREYKEIIIESGALKFEVTEHPFPIVVRSPLFEILPPIGESAFIYDPVRALAEAFVFKGQMEFRALNAEEVVSLKAGQKVLFQGLLEEGEISYDLLLHGHKIPKGKLMKPETIKREDQQAYSPLMSQKRLAELKKKQSQQQRAETEIKAKSLCQKPLGQLNECQWKQQGAVCFRSRCVADGRWKDRQRVDDSSCEAKIRVGKCDY